MKHLIWWLLCRLGYHDWELEGRKVLYYGARKGHGKNRQVREWSVRQERVGCWKCTWKPGDPD